MWDRIFDISALAFLMLAAAVGLLAGFDAGRRHREGIGGMMRRAVEAALLAPLGGFLARTFVGLLLYGAGDSPAAGLVVGWAFFLWPGVVDSPIALMHGQPLFTPTVLLWLAAAVGSFVGLMDGLGRIHAWRGRGALTFALDVTWGLAGSANGCLIHLANLILRAPRDAGSRGGAHRYFDGFRIKSGYAVTLGAVMSNLPAHAGDLVKHERQHVLQNRLFGPLYTLTYLGWMAATLVPALTVGAATGSPFRTVEDWCYLNNPWEAWAFAHGGWRDPARVWPVVVRSAASVLFFVGALAAALWVVQQVWLP